MDDEKDPSRKCLRPLFPNLTEKELKAVEETFYGYLEIVLKIFQRKEAEREQKEQEIQGQPEFDSPRGLSPNRDS